MRILVTGHKDDIAAFAGPFCVLLAVELSTWTPICLSAATSEKPWGDLTSADLKGEAMDIWSRCRIIR
jgi:hypothetical protein